MRAGPIGLLPAVPAVLEIAAAQARITQDSPDGTGAALMVHDQARGLGPVEDLPGFLAVHVPAVDWPRPHRGSAGP